MVNVCMNPLLLNHTLEEHRIVLRPFYEYLFIDDYVR